MKIVKKELQVQGEAEIRFNKSHLVDPQLCKWRLKTNGHTFYINHVEYNSPWKQAEESATNIRLKDVNVLLSGESAIITESKGGVYQ